MWAVCAAVTKVSEKRRDQARPDKRSTNQMTPLLLLLLLLLSSTLTIVIKSVEEHS